MNSTKIIILSAADKPTLERMSGRLHQWINDKTSHPKPQTFMDDLAYTLNSRRSLLPQRSFAVLNNQDVIRGLNDALSAPIRSIKDPKVAFVFTGQGAQWAGMAKELLGFPIFRENIEDSGKFLKNIGFDWDIEGRWCMPGFYFYQYNFLT